MFVLSQFKYRKFIKEFFPKDCPLVASLKNLLVENEDKGEVDFVVLHRRIGVILIEVKGNTEFNSDRYDEAKKREGNKFLYCSNVRVTNCVVCNGLVISYSSCRFNSTYDYLARYLGLACLLLCVLILGLFDVVT